MQDMEVMLPGGLLINGAVERRARFNQINGIIELALIELDHDDDLSFVTSLLARVVCSIGDVSVDEGTVNALCMADRQFLMLRLAAMLEGEQVWLKATCGKCGSPFDVEIKRCDLPVKEAGDGYPETSVRLSNEMVVVVRIPTAIDQMSVMHLSETEAVHRLLSRCLTKKDGELLQADWVDLLSDKDIERIDDALDRLSPAVCNELLVTCPECRIEQHAVLNHYQLTGLNAGLFFKEVHTIAMHYHWSEEEILGMPRERRSRYLNLIDRSRGMVGGEA